MRSSIKKQLAEMVEYIDFPMGVYVYETGKLIAGNRSAKALINGSACQNVNLLWPNQKKLKLSPKILAGKNQIFLEKQIMIGDELCLVDFEVMVIPLPSEHIVVVFLEKSYKQAFRVDMEKFMPGMLWTNAEGEYVAMNNAVRFGLERYLYLRDHQELATKDEKMMIETIEHEYQEVIREKKPAFCRVEQIDFNQENSGYVNMSKLPIIGKKEEFFGVLMLCNPVVSQQDYKRVFNSARFENTLLRECMMESQKIVVSVAKQGDMQIRYMTPNFEMLGYDQEEIFLHQLNWLNLVVEEDRERVVNELQDADRNKQRLVKQKYRIQTASGEVRWIDSVTTGNDLQNDGDMIHILFRLTDVGVLEVDKPKVIIKHETYLDFLTGLPNRLKYEEDADKQIEIALESHRKGYVIALDLDDFKHINEGLGPQYGDLLLKKVSKALNNISYVENYCYRVDGDEFVLFVRSEYVKKVEEIVQKCLECFHDSWELDDKDCFCSVSIGIAEYPKDSTNARELLKCADAAVYEAKRKGKNRIQHYKKAVLNSSVERVNYEKYLRKAIAKGCMEFEMFFQPVVTNQTKKLVSAEALVRWYSPELGFITPIHFISLSEYLGLIVPLGEYVLQQTFSKCKYWNDHYDPDFKVSVNLSVVQLVQMSIVDRIMEIARVTGVNTKNIILEVTESLAVEDMNLMKSVLTELKNQGFSIALDDFGTGYSSLNHIMEMPLDYVKIDRSFVSGYGTESFNPSLLSAITELAHSVNMEVIVEGVETKQQMEFLMFLQADKIQGYLYGKPMAAEEFEKKFFGGE